MKIDPKKAIEGVPFFTITGFKQILHASESDTQRIRETLARWVKSGRILRLKNGVYMSWRFYERHRSEADFSLAVSAVMNPLSYISLEYVLQRAGVLTEITYPVTAVTLKNTRVIENSLGTFVYRHVKQEYYLGFSQGNFYGVVFNQASPAKALFDYCYLRPLPRAIRTARFDLAEDLRLNLDRLSPSDWYEFETYMESQDTPKLKFIRENLRRAVWQP